MDQEIISHRVGEGFLGDVIDWSQLGRPVSTSRGVIQFSSAYVHHRPSLAVTIRPIVTGSAACENGKVKNETVAHGASQATIKARAT